MIAVLRLVLLSLAMLAAVARPARAEDEEDDGEVLTAAKFDPSTCGKTAPPAASAAPTTPPVTWSDF